MAVKVPGFARLLVALTLLGWGQFGFAEDYYWQYGTSPKYPTALAACEAWFAPHAANYSFRTWRESATTIHCYADYKNQPGNWWQKQIVHRSGTTCPPGTEYDSSIQECVTPKNCWDLPNVDRAVKCPFVMQDGKQVVQCPESISFDGCSFGLNQTELTKKCWKEPIQGSSTGLENWCVANYFANGPEKPSDDPCPSDGSCSPWDQPTPGANCVMVNGREVCRDPNDNECIKVDGSNKCIMDEMQCNYVNLVLQCTVGDKPQRNCAYHNGKQVCTDPNDPNKLIDENSPDHPKNGGNADGDETNDPKEPGSEGGTAQDGDAAATNEAIKDLQDGLGGKIDKTNSLLEQIKKGLLGDDYSSDAEWTDEGAKASGEGAGGQIASALDTAVDEALEGSEAELKDALDALPGTVEGWFGVGGERLAGVGVLDNLFPSAVGCSDYRVNVGIPRYSFTLVVPTCELSRVKPLLEWLLWCLTAVGVWNIYMSGLRLENAKAIRGGF